MDAGALPFLMRPAAKDYLWGGRRLNDDFGKSIGLTPLAETWECSTHPDGPSVCSGGEYDGMTLTEVLRAHPEYLGTHPLQLTGGRPELPILVKLIDAEKDLSVQVHPDDGYAKTREHGMGKTEMWYILKAKKGAKIVYGFNRDMTREGLRAAAGSGEILRCLRTVPVEKDDIFYIEAGRVHAIGAGILLAEIQENSNLTYRLYDYDRTDRAGRKRELHVEKALDVAILSSGAEPKQPMRVLRYRRACASELLTRCKYFQVERLLLNTETARAPVPYRAGSNSFRVLLCIDGCGSVRGENYFENIYKGDCFFIPADSVPLYLHGKACFLDVTC